MSGATFCPECGTENQAGLTHCQSCGYGLDPMLEAQAQAAAHRPLRWPVFGLTAGIATAVVVLAWLTGLTVPLDVFEVPRFNAQEGDWELVEVLGGAGTPTTVFASVIGFGLAGMIAAFVFQGRYLREVALGAAAAMALQGLLWLATLFMSGGTLSYELWIEGRGFAMRGPGAILLGQMLLLHLFGAVVFAFASWIAVEQLTGKARCVHCHEQYSLRPQPPRRCPSCGAAQQRDGVQWGYVMIGSLVTMGLFILLVGPLGESLGIGMSCDPYDLTDACREARKDGAWTIFQLAVGGEDRPSSGDLELQLFGMRPEVTWQLFHTYRYLGIVGGLMLIAPLVLSLLVPRGSRSSAGAMIVLNWFLVTFALLELWSDISSVDGGFVFLMRTQILALVAWGVAGFIGAMVGDRIRFSRGSAYLDEIED